jgi:hypothetical protein
MIDLARGKKATSKFPQPDSLNRFFGIFKTIKERDIYRIVLQMLRLRIVKESFQANKVRGGGSIVNISVYLHLGKQAIKFKQGEISVSITDGISQTDQVNFHEEQEELKNTIQNNVIANPPQPQSTRYEKKYSKLDIVP